MILFAQLINIPPRSFLVPILCSITICLYCILSIFAFMSLITLDAAGTQFTIWHISLNLVSCILRLED